jgi:hypothetical protein
MSVYEIAVMRGLDPAIHQPKDSSSIRMDVRVKPAHDERGRRSPLRNLCANEAA